MRNNPTILFDNDGVLVHTEPLYYEASRRVLEEVDTPLSLDQFRQISLKRGESVIDLALSQGVPQEKVNLLREKRNSVYTELLHTGVPIRKGIPKLLETISKKARLGIVTSSRKDHFSIIHQQTGFLEHFDFVLTREDFEKPKPHPDAYLKAIDKHQVDSDHCLVIEDSERGLAAAKNANLPCFVYWHELCEGGDFSSADKILKAGSELEKEIVNWLELAS